MKPLIVTDGALNVLSSQDFSLEDICDETTPRKVVGTAHVAVESSGIYVFTATSSKTSHLLVIRRSPDGLFAAVPSDERRSVFDRCARIAMHSFDQSIALNPRWMCHHEGNRLSIFARGIGHDERLAVEIMSPTLDAYVFSFAPAPELQNLSDSSPDYHVYRDVRAAFPEV
jgi:hypothetical protein